MVSIVMPLRNQARFLGAALESVLGQSHDDLELAAVRIQRDDMEHNHFARTGDFLEELA